MATRPNKRARGGLVWILRQLGRRVWVRATAFTLAALVFALAAGIVGSLLPFDVSIDLGQNSVGSLLQIIATAMLTATTFSVTAMVTAYSSATTNATPRASQLLIADPTSQSALSTFVGAFVFAMVGIIALSTGYYTEQGRTILFLGTLAVVALVVVTLLRWIAHLADFGRMADVIDRVERAATETMTAYATSPTLGGTRHVGPTPTGEPIWAPQTGYVTHVDIAALQKVAERARTHIFIGAHPGQIADRTRPLARLARPAEKDERDDIIKAFRLAPHRDFEQDPRLGAIALAEIGSRALSPATNDPGTAIEVLSAAQRVFEAALTTRPDTAIPYPAVHVTPPKLEDLLSDTFRPLARDGSGNIEVQLRLQKALSALAACSPDNRALFKATARDAWSRARRALPDRDVDTLRTEMKSVWADHRS